MSAHIAALVASALLLVAVASPAVASGRTVNASTVKLIIADPGTEHKLHTFVGLGNEKICVWATPVDQDFYNIPAHYRRSLNGGPKDLDIHSDRKCFFSKPGTYVVYGSPIDVRTKFHVETWAVFDHPRDYERSRPGGLREVN